MSQPVIAMSSLGLNGRFANQVFQYAFIKTYGRRHGLQVQTPRWIGSLLFGCSDPLVSRPLRPVNQEGWDKAGGPPPVHDGILDSKEPLRDVDVWGYFQYHTSWHAPDREFIRSLFRPAPATAARLAPAVAKLRAAGETVVGLHLRRGDFGYGYFYMAPDEWYLDWLGRLWPSLSRPALFIASDEPDRVTGAYRRYNPITSADLGVSFAEAPYYPDFHLLSLCDHLAISNSSFSFAASMLNEKAASFVRPSHARRQLVAYDPWNADPLERDVNMGEASAVQVRLANEGLAAQGRALAAADVTDHAERGDGDAGPAMPSVNVLACCLASAGYNREVLFSTREVIAGPDVQNAMRGGEYRTIRTPQGEYDAGRLAGLLPQSQKPDILIVRADASRANMPANTAALRCPRVLIVGDTHHQTRPIRTMVDYAMRERFDYVIGEYDRHHLHWFVEAGVPNVYWLPGLTIANRPQPWFDTWWYPLAFVGQAGGMHRYRRYVLEELRRRGLWVRHFLLPGQKAADTYARTLINLNVSLNGDLNNRVFEILSCGGFMVCDRLSEESGLGLLFREGVHYAAFGSVDELQQVIEHYLTHPQEAKAIGRQGLAAYRAQHTPERKVRQLMDLVLGGRRDAVLDARGDRRSAMAPAGGVEAVLGRAALYELLQEMHAQSREPGVLFAGNADARLICDAVDLPRMTVAVLDPVSGGAAAGGDAVAKCGCAGRVRSVDKTDPWLKLRVWDCLAVDAATVLRVPVGEMLRMAAFNHAVLCGGAAAGQVEEAEGRLAEAGMVRLEPGVSAFGWQSAAALGERLAQLGEFRSALKVFSQALDADPEDTACLKGLGRLAERTGDRDTAASLYRNALTIKPGDSEAAELIRSLETRKVGDRIVPPPRPETGGSSSPAPSGAPAPTVTPARRPLRILLITNLYPPQELGGYGRLMADFAAILQSRGHTVHVLTSDTRYLGDPAPGETGVDRTLELFGGWKDGHAWFQGQEAALQVGVRNSRLVTRVMQMVRPDVCLLGNIDFIGHLLMGPLLDHSIPIVHHLGNAHPGFHVPNTPTNPLYRMAAASAWLAGEVRRQGYVLDRIEVVYPGAFVKDFASVTPAPVGSLRIAYAGIVLPYKGADVLVKALPLLRDQGVDFSATLAGATTDPAFVDGLRRFATEQGIGDRVSFPGHLGREDLKALFGRHNVLAFPSIVNEAFGISQVEAMAAGLAVVSSATGGAAEVVEDGVSGLVFEAGDHRSLARRLLSLHADHDRWRRIGQAGRRRALGEFDIERSVDKLESLFVELLALAPAR